MIFSVWLRIVSNPANFNRFRIHAEKYFLRNSKLDLHFLQAAEMTGLGSSLQEPGGGAHHHLLSLQESHLAASLQESHLAASLQESAHHLAAASSQYHTVTAANSSEADKYNLFP